MSEEFSRSGPTLAHRPFWEPPVDVLEDRDCVLVKAELGGVHCHDIELIYSASRNTLMIRGVRLEEDKPPAPRVTCYQLEIFYGEFEREVRLPDLDLDPDGIKAHYRNGFLVVSIPKRAASNEGGHGRG